MPASTLPFYKVNPGGNPTILVRDNSLFSPEVSPAKRAVIARALMDSNCIGAEQVGFLDTSRALPHMEMMGGEFCINATRAAALVFALNGLVPETDTPGIHEGIITTSGATEAVCVRVRRQSSGLPPSTTTAYEAAVALLLAATARTDLARELAPGQVLVRLPGITHLLLDAAQYPLPDHPLVAAKGKLAEYGLEKEEAAGVIWHLPGPDGMVSITPIVHVAATNSTVVETACGSGSLALALVLAQSAAQTIAIRQPSGHALTVTFEPPVTPEASMTAWINGITRLTAKGTAYL